MANPRQRRKSKAKASAVQQSRRQKQNLRKKKAPKGPAQLFDAWDPHRTVNQNYAALGLAPSLKVYAPGGAEDKNSRPFSIELGNPEANDCTEEPVHPHSTHPIQRGRIVRDEKGNVVSVELPDENLEGNSPNTPWGTPFESDKPPTAIQAKTDLVRSLENLSEKRSKKARHTSKGELATLKALVAAHGEDTEAMARDRRKNVMQRTSGQITAAINKAGGFEALRS